MRLGDPTKGGPRKAARGELGKCKAGGCEKRAIAWHFCANHYRRLKAYGSETGGKYVQDGRTKDWFLDGGGYVMKFDKSNPNAGANGFVYQHREVMASMIGRVLMPNESVHHKNGNRSDNRPENLELWVKSQPAGQRVEDLLKWATEIVNTYGGLRQIHSI